MPVLEARLVSAKEYRNDGPVVLRFELTNSEDDDLYILTWYTPLEGLFSDCLEVLRNGEKVPYDGPLAKRGRPSVENYVLVRTGQTVSNEFRLNDAYDISMPGHYSVVLDAVIRDYVSAESPTQFRAKVGDTDRTQAKQELDRVETEFAVLPGDGEPIVPWGEKVRYEEKAKHDSDESENVAAKQKFAAPKDPTLVGGSASQQAQTKQAHIDGFKLCEDALGALANDAAYKEWFGVYTAARFATVKDHYTKIRDRMQSTTFTYDLTGTGCQSNWFAYTFFNSTTIWMCNNFWSAPATGTDSKAGTVVHEHSHSDAGTDDVTYGQANCRDLAKNKPDDAIRNADNHEYYAKG